MSEPEQIRSLPILPLKNSVLFPFVWMPLTVGRPASVAAIEAVLAREDKELVVAAQRDASVEAPGPQDFFSIGTKAVVKRMARRPDGSWDGAISIWEEVSSPRGGNRKREPSTGAPPTRTASVRRIWRALFSVLKDRARESGRCGFSD